MGLVRVHPVAGSGAKIISTNNQVLCRACRYYIGFNASESIAEMSGVSHQLR